MTPKPADILVVDDNAANLKLARVILQKEGHTVRTVIDAEEALVLLKSWRPALILMDIQLPGLDGLELTRRLKAEPEHRDTIIIALTAFAMPSDRERALAAGCDDYLSKPIDIEGLVACVNRHLTSGARP